MEIKKIIYLLFFSFICSLSASANQWFDFGKEILAENNNQQISYWLDFLEKQTLNDFTTNSYNEKIYTINNCIIVENSSNEYGGASKGGIKSHLYVIRTIDNKSITIVISKDKIEFCLGINNKNIYWIILTKSKTEYKYFEYDGSFSFTITEKN